VFEWLGAVPLVHANFEALRKDGGGGDVAQRTLKVRQLMEFRWRGNLGDRFGHGWEDERRLQTRQLLSGAFRAIQLML
jgi:hypothetical protein